MSNNAAIPARFRLMLQQQFSSLFNKNVISVAQAHERACAHNNYELAEQLQQTLLKELETAIAVIRGEAMWDGQTNEFNKVGAQAEQHKLLLERKGNNF